MADAYWRLEYVRTADGDDRCVMLYGAEDEVVGPMTLELAEAWIDYFDNRRRVGDSSPVDLSQIVPARNRPYLPPA
jgi:hypothetical protein